MNPTSASGPSSSSRKPGTPEYGTGIIAVNGVASAPESARISAMDRGFLLADSVFEVMVAFNGVILDAGAHLARLRSSASDLEIPVPWSDESLLLELQSLVDQVPTSKISIRVVVTRGEGMGIGVGDKAFAPSRMIFALPAPAQPATVYRDGIALRSNNKGYTIRQATPKASGNYVQTIVATTAAQREGFADILWTNADGELTEAGTANVFFVGRTGDQVEIATPSLNSGILAGITRARIISLLTSAGIPVTERIIFADELPGFDEAFLCSSVRGLVPIARVDQQKLFTLRETAVFRHIDRLFLTWVETQVGKRVDWNTGRVLTAAHATAH